MERWYRPLTHVSLYTTKPSGWEVAFSPEHLEEVQPVSLIQKPEKIAVRIKPAARDMPGDSTVSLVAATTQDREQMDLWVAVGVRMG